MILNYDKRNSDSIIVRKIPKIFSIVIFLVTILLLFSKIGLCTDFFWQESGVPISIAQNDQKFFKTATDKCGGVFLVWVDYKDDFFGDIYAQRLDINGKALWRENGVLVCSSESEQNALDLVACDSGEAIVVWNDRRSWTKFDIYAQKLDCNGAFLWSPNGVPVCTLLSDQTCPKITSDGKGGAIVVWQDKRSGFSYDIYAQRINKFGEILWTQGGIAIGKTPYSETYPQIISDEEGGAIVAWNQRSDLLTGDIYAQKIDSSGNILWKEDGVLICKLFGNQSGILLVPDGKGGAIISWLLYKEKDSDIYAQRIDKNGTLRWLPQEICICSEKGAETNLSITSDGGGGAVFCWSDYRNKNWDIYAQRIDSEGYTLWRKNGILVCSSFGPQWNPKVALFDKEKYFFTWEDNRSHTSLIYAQALDSSGNFLWDKNGVFVCWSDSDQTHPDIVSNGKGGVVIFWIDRRFACADIYSQSVMEFLLGDANRDDKIDSFNVGYLASFLLAGGPPPVPQASGDFNCDLTISLSDVLLLRNSIFKKNFYPFSQ